MLPIKQDNSGGVELEEASEVGMQVQPSNKSFAECGKEVMTHMAQKIKASVEGKSSKSLGDKNAKGGKGRDNTVRRGRGCRWQRMRRQSTRR